jgi:hypothetical protein
MISNRPEKYLIRLSPFRREVHRLHRKKLNFAMASDAASELALASMTIAGKPFPCTDAGHLRENDGWNEKRMSEKMADMR